MVDASSGGRGEKRVRIIESAIEVFAEKGFHQARVTDIAQRAGVADGTIYLYFRNKEDLLLTIFEEKMDTINEGALHELAPIADPLERIRAFARYHFRLVRENRALAEVLQVELRLSNKFLKEYRPVKLWTYLGIFSGIIRQGQKQGVFRTDLDRFIVMWSFFGALDELAMQWVLSRKRPKFDMESAAETVADIFIRGIVA